MTDTERNERLFKLLGWEWIYGMWHHPEGKLKKIPSLVILPNPCQNWPEFKKYGLEEMQARDFHFDVIMSVAVWIHTDGSTQYTKPIKCNEILRAGVDAMIEFLEGEQ